MRQLVGCDGFVEWLSGKTGKQYRLLSEAEWEYASRAGTATPFSTGNIITPDQANFNGNYTYGGTSKGVYRARTTTVGSFPANPFGLHDVHGNVLEWVADCWNDTYVGAPSDGTAWTSGDSDLSIVRSGAWLFGPTNARSADRFQIIKQQQYNVIGFHVARKVTRESAE